MSAATHDVGSADKRPIADMLAALARDDPAGVVGALDTQIHQRRPGSPVAVRQQVGEQLAIALADQSGRRITPWIDAMAGSASPTARQVACLLLARRYHETRLRWRNDRERRPTAELVGPLKRR